MQTSESLMAPNTPCTAGNMRTAGFFLVGCLTVLVVFWMYVEQGAVRSCTNPQNPAPIYTPPAAQNIIIQMPTVAPKNESSLPKDTWDYNWDRKAWKNPEDANGVQIRTIILIRHGQYDLSGDNEGHLTELGKMQANYTGRRLLEMNIPYAHIICSTLPRARETAHIIASYFPNLPLMEDSLLIEGGPTPPFPTISYWGLPERAYFQDGPRMEAAFRKYFYRADPSQQEHTFEILVGHGNIFRFLALRALQFPSEAWMRVFIPHASITVLDMLPEGVVKMDKFGEAGYMPLYSVTY